MSLQLIFQNIKKIYSKEKNVHFVSNDKDFLAACKGLLTNLQIYRSLDESIKSDICKAFIDVDESEKTLIRAYCENNSQEFQNRIAEIVPNFLAWKHISSNKIPDDNNECTIVSSSEPDYVSCDFSEAIYYGEGILVVPCNFKTDVEVSYYLYKADYYAMDQILSVSDHNDHYFEVEESIQISVKALIRFEFEIQKNEALKGIYLRNCEIDSLKQIEMTS
ncbi:MAG: hypothetical protein K0S27_1519 [Gammaproteobacteria bacterium]|jgi:hypothetical protein|nr:hypothetical protein [Gammaproteobacteria bacterium]